MSKGVKRGSQEVTEVEREWGREREREGGEREGLGRGNNGLTKD